MEIKVSGLKEIEAQLVALGSKTGTRILRASMLAAAKPITEQAKSNVAAIQGGSGALYQAIGQRFFIGNKAGTGELGLPAMGGKFSVKIFPFSKNRTAIALHNLVYGRKRKGIFYGHLIEFGHKIVRRTGETSTSRGRRGRSYTKYLTRELGSVPAHPFLGPALRSKGAASVQLLADELRVRIDKQLSANARKAR
jgi:hypothetical protein